MALFRRRCVCAFLSNNNHNYYTILGLCIYVRECDFWAQPKAANIRRINFIAGSSECVHTLH